MATDWTLRELASMTQQHLSSLYEREVPLAPPRARYRGRFLTWIEPSASRHPRVRCIQRVSFEWAPWGIDFDQRLWFFFTPRLAVGRFEPLVEDSRWRDTRAVQLRYDVSRLPDVIRRHLYDEVKPLSDRWMLGIGGTDAERGEGDHFFFALERLDR